MTAKICRLHNRRIVATPRGPDSTRFEFRRLDADRKISRVSINLSDEAVLAMADYVREKHRHQRKVSP